MDLDALAAAGLYDAADPDAEERRALLEFLTEQGCSVEEMVAAHSRGRLFALAGDRVILPERDRFTLAEVADQVDASVADVRRLWRGFGLVEARPDAAVASPADVEMVRTMMFMASFVGLEPTVGVARVMGSSLARISDAASTVVRSRYPAVSVATSGSELETARAFAVIARAVPPLGQALDRLFRHHLEAARMHFEGTDSWDVVGEGGIRVAVGFADLCGFTGMTQQMSMDDLSQLLTRFEEVAADVVRECNGRLVKYIGDAVMYVAVDVATAVDIAESLLREAKVRGLTARAGVTVGTALALDGDYFGPVVNLAARLVALADPGSVFASDEVVRGLAGSRAATPLGPQPIRGFAEPVSVSRLAAVV